MSSRLQHSDRCRYMSWMLIAVTAALLSALASEPAISASKAPSPKKTSTKRVGPEKTAGPKSASEKQPLAQMGAFTPGTKLLRKGKPVPGLKLGTPIFPHDLLKVPK